MISTCLVVIGSICLNGSLTIATRDTSLGQSAEVSGEGFQLSVVLASDNVRTPDWARTFAEPPPIQGSFLFIERETAKGKLWIRVLRWCLSPCQLEVDKLGTAVRAGIEGTAGKGT